MVTIDDFLNKYKELETELRDTDTTVLDFESALSADDADRLKICRQIRNYVQHHSDDFLSATPAMCKFIENTLEGVKAKREKVKDRMKRIKAISETDKLEDVCKWMDKNKKNYAPVVDKDGLFLGVITMAMLITGLTELSIKRKVRELEDKITKAGKGEVQVAAITDDLEKFEYGEDVIVVDKGKYKGIVKW